MQQSVMRKSKMKGTKYHVGDIVVVRPDLNLGRHYFMQSGIKDDEPWRSVSDIVTEDMMEFRGQSIKIERIVDVVDGKKYTAKARYWTDEMFIDSAEAECFCESLL